jgi:hypothetical protein
MTSREDFFALFDKQKSDKVLFFPDITNYYVAHRVKEGEERPYSPGQFIPDDAPIHRLRGTMPEEFKDWTCMDFYKHFNWGFPTHIYNWYDVTYSGGVERITTKDAHTRTTLFKTPKGTLTKVDLLANDGSWCTTEHLVKDPAGLDIMQYVVENTHYTVDNAKVQKLMNQMGGSGLGDLVIPRSPFGKLVHEYMGFETVIFAMADDGQKLIDFMKIQAVKDLELVNLAAQAPEKLIILSDHTDEFLISPPQYVEYCIPYYQKVCEILHRAGKLVSTHLDGNFKGYFPYLKDTGFDLLDGCTPYPMFNYHPEELAAALPEGMYAYCGVPSGFFADGSSVEKIIEFGEKNVKAGNGRFILNVGDILPTNGDIYKVIELGRHIQQIK